ncbi:MAG: SGNH/GDSL hydrolase family protein [Planctomycetota bacterium]
MTTERTLTWRGKLLLSILSPIVVFGLLEIALRIGGFRHEPWRAHLEGRTYDELQQLEIYEPHPELLWTLRPSTRLDLPQGGFVGMETNSLGLRDRDIPGPKGPNDFRVLCMGDSVTFGLGLADGETWADRMEEALRRSPETAGKNVFVLNAGVPGWSSVQGMRNLERLSTFEPDVIVFWYGLADAHDMHDLPDSAQLMPLEGVKRAMAGLWRLRVFQLVQKVVTGVRRSTAEGTRVSRAEYRQHVERLSDLDRAGGPKVIFVHEPERCNQTIAQLKHVVASAEQRGAEVILAPTRLLSWIIPVPDGYLVSGRRTTHRGRPAILFPADPRFPGCEKVDLAAEYEMVRENLESLVRQKANFDRLLKALPQESVRYRDLFGGASPEEVFMDNCHLTPFGSRLAGAALAKIALERAR